MELISYLRNPFLALGINSFSGNRFSNDENDWTTLFLPSILCSSENGASKE